MISVSLNKPRDKIGSLGLSLFLCSFALFSPFYFFGSMTPNRSHATKQVLFVFWGTKILSVLTLRHNVTWCVCMQVSMWGLSFATSTPSQGLQSCCCKCAICLALCPLRHAFVSDVTIPYIEPSIVNIDQWRHRLAFCVKYHMAVCMAYICSWSFQCRLAFTV